MTEQRIERVHHREKQPIRAEDLTAEQQYHIAMRRRHQVGLHGWGIVRGLELSVEQDQLQIGAGLAVDGYGRFLTVSQNWIIESSVLTDKPFTDAPIDIWLLYARIPEDAVGDDQACRWRETAHIRLTVAEGDPPDPYALPFPADPCLPYGPHEMPSDDPADEWPIYLGRVRYYEGSLDKQDVKRPYISLHAAHITPPAEQVQLRLGGQAVTDKRRFAISLSGEKEGTWQEQLTIDRDKHIRFPVHTVMSYLRLENGLKFEPLTAVPTTASPWQIYRVQTKEAGRTINEWHWEIGQPTDDTEPNQYQMQIGFSTDSGFIPSLCVLADGTVILKGDVAGTIKRAPIQPDLDEPAFVGALVETSHKAMMASVAINDPTVAGLLEVAFENPPTQVHINSAILYNFEGQNVGASPVTAVTVYEHVYRNETFISHRILGSDLNIMAGNSASFDNMLTTPSGLNMGDRVTIVVTAVGQGPFANIVAGTSRFDVAVTRPVSDL